VWRCNGRDDGGIESASAKTTPSKESRMKSRELRVPARPPSLGRDGGLATLNSQLFCGWGKVAVRWIVG
jgi:hypothetical protein